MIGTTISHYKITAKLGQGGVGEVYLGEALNRLRRNDPETAGRIGDTPRIVAFRNILAHGYDTIDHEIVWHLIQQDLPGLLQVVEDLLGESPTP